MYNGNSLVNDLIPRIDETNPEHYKLFAIRTMVMPPVSGLPEFLRAAGDYGKYRVAEAPGTGYFGVVDVPVAAAASRENFYALCDPWMHSAWLGQQRYVWLDFAGEAPREMPRVTPGYLPEMAVGVAPGTVASERQSGQVYSAEVEAARDAWVLFRMAWHPAWSVTVDGAKVKSVMVTPGFTAARVEAGRHRVECRYEPGWAKWWWLSAGWLLVAVMWVVERRRSTTIAP
jgi:hypothetical protein